MAGRVLRNGAGVKQHLSLEQIGDDMPQVTITSVRSIFSIKPGRVGGKDTQITYTTDAGAQGSLILPIENPTSNDIQKAVTEELALQKHVGSKFSVL